MYGKAFREFYEIIDYMSVEKTSKLPKNFMDYVISNVDWDHKFIYDTTKNLEDQNLQPETYTLLTMMYLKYFASEEEKIDVIKQMKQNDIDDEKEKIERYKVIQFNNTFNTTKNTSSVSSNSEKMIPVVFKEKWYQKILRNVKKLINKK